MTEQEKNNYNKMLNILYKIGEAYKTPEEMQNSSEEEYGLEYEEALEMAYENIQEEAKFCIKGITHIK